MKNDRFIVSLTIQVFFLQIFEQVKQWLLLELHGIIRLLHLVLCPLLKPTKNEHFQVFLAVWVLLPKFLGRLRSDLCMLKLPKVIRVSHAVACPIVFILFYLRGWQEECSKLRKMIIFQYFWSFGYFFPSFWVGQGMAYCFVIEVNRVECYYLQKKVKEQHILEQYEMIRVSHLVAWLMVFKLPCHHSRQAGVLELTKKFNFNYFLYVWTG